ncbi:MAG: hypothetical protein II882_00605 [Lachnospiraceae bacterium]|nr:hypothetical protein [Lachnospiraceae bacterium]
MESQKKIYSNAETAFSLSDIFWYILRQWRILLIIMGACALLLGAYRGLTLNKQRVAAAKKASTTQSGKQSTESGDPAIIEQPKDYSVSEGNNAVFHIATSGKVTKYQWQYSKDGMSWSSVNTGTYPSASTDTLTFTSKSTQNGYMFRCVVTFENEKNTSSKGATLTVTASTGSKITVKSMLFGAAKYCILGLFVGLFLGAVWFAVVFVANGFVTNDLPLKARYNLPVFGVYPTADKGSGEKNIWQRFDRFILNKASHRPNLSHAKSARLIAANLAMHAQSKEILLMGTVPGEMLERISKVVQHYLNCEVQVGGNVHSSADAVVALTGGQNVVCVEQIHYSKQRLLDNEMEAIAASPAECIGFILVE